MFLEVIISRRIVGNTNICASGVVIFSLSMV